MTNTNLTMNDLESIRQAASEVGDFETSRLANLAMWGETDLERAKARRKLQGRR